METKYKEWNQKQEELFELFFTKQKEDTINLKKLVDLSKPIQKIWEGLYSILEKSIMHFDKLSQIEQIKTITHENKRYLILKIDLWKYVIIDLESKQTLLKEQAAKIFIEDSFVLNFKERKGYEPTAFYHFYECSKESTQKIIEYYNEYEETLTENKKIKYSITYEDSTTFISIEISRLRIILGFNRISTGDLNYLFINNELTAIGASNPTENNESLLKMVSRVCEIEIPKSLIPENLLKLITKYQKGQDDGKRISLKIN